MYNTTMPMTHTHKRHIASLLAIPLLLVSQMAYAQYVTPDEALDGLGLSPLSDQFMNDVVTPRNAADRLAAQQSSVGALRDAEFQAIYNAQHPAAPAQRGSRSSN